MILVLDLILLKPRVFLHLLFNRGSVPLNAIGPEVDERTKRLRRERVLRDDLARLGALTIFAETIVRLLSHLSAGGVQTGLILWTVMTVIAEMLAQYLITTLIALAILRWRGWYPFSARSSSGKAEERDGRRENFRYVSYPPLFFVN